MPSYSLLAQNEEPVSNIGKTFHEMNSSVFPGMKYKGQRNGKIEYEWKDSEDEDILYIFAFSNNILVSECMKISSDNGFASLFYNSLCDKFIGQYRWALTSSITGHQHFVFSKYSLDIILETNQASELLLFVYNKL